MNIDFLSGHRAPARISALIPYFSVYSLGGHLTHTYFGLGAGELGENVVHAMGCNWDEMEAVNMSIIATLQRRGAYRGKLKQAIDDGMIFQMAEDGGGEGMTTTRIESILVDAREAAALCGLGVSTWYNLVASDKTPASVRLGRSVKWRRDELTRWIVAGCPARQTWEEMAK